MTLPCPLQALREREPDATLTRGALDMISEFRMTDSRLQFAVCEQLQRLGYDASCKTTSFLPVLCVRHSARRVSDVNELVHVGDATASRVSSTRPAAAAPCTSRDQNDGAPTTDFLMSSRWVQHEARAELLELGYQAACLDLPAGPTLAVVITSESDAAQIESVLSRIDPEGDDLFRTG